MSARHKLNVSFVNGILLVAGVVAAIAASWSLFFVLTAILVGLAIYAGDIRLRPRRGASSPVCAKSQGCR